MRFKEFWNLDNQSFLGSCITICPHRLLIVLDLDLWLNRRWQSLFCSSQSSAAPDPGAVCEIRLCSGLKHRRVLQTRDIENVLWNGVGSNIQINCWTLFGTSLNRPTIQFPFILITLISNNWHRMVSCFHLKLLPVKHCWLGSQSFGENCWALTPLTLRCCVWLAGHKWYELDWGLFI